ncbi:hypothetical protein NFI96_018584 [Prochilodus magdalenae]|nr:hypothetical protein NFI96_018584 [Prochilodus magdalenae]
MEGRRRAKGFETARKVYDKLEEISSSSSSQVSPFPACSLSGSPGVQKCYFAIQASYGSAQFCSVEWEEVCVQQGDSEETTSSAVDACISAVQEQEEQSLQSEATTLTEIYEEAAEALHQLADKLPPPGRILLDVIMLCEEEAGLKDFLPVIGSLKHMQAWHSAHVNIVTEYSAGWSTAASYLSAGVCSPAAVLHCIDDRELWRGALLIKERKFVSELLFEGFSLKVQSRSSWSRMLFPPCSADQELCAEVFHYYQPVLELLQLVKITDFPLLLQSSAELELTVYKCGGHSRRSDQLVEHLESETLWWVFRSRIPWKLKNAALTCIGASRLPVCITTLTCTSSSLCSSSAKARLLLDQLRTLRGEVGALFCLSCVISAEAFPPATQLSASKWRDFMAKRPKVLSAPDVELKGEKGHYLLLVQGAESGGCKARLIHSANQINGAVALATHNSLIREKDASPAGTTRISDWLRSLPCLRGDQLLRRERSLDRVQVQVLQECFPSPRLPHSVPPKPTAAPLSQPTTAPLSQPTTAPLSPTQVNSCPAQPAHDCPTQSHPSQQLPRSASPRLPHSAPPKPTAASLSQPTTAPLSPTQANSCLTQPAHDCPTQPHPSQQLPHSASPRLPHSAPPKPTAAPLSPQLPAPPMTTHDCPAQPAHDCPTQPHPSQQLPHSASPRLPRSANPRLPRSASPRLPHSASPRLPHSASPRLPRSASPRLPRSASPRLPHSANPRLPRSANPRLPHSASPRLPHSASPRLPRSASPRLPRSASPRLPRSLGRRQQAQKPAAAPLNDLKVLLNLAREQYLSMQTSTLPKASECVPTEKDSRTSVTQTGTKRTIHSEWPERSVLRNYENMQKIRHRSRSSLFSGVSSESLMGPKDGQRSSSAQLDARELLKHFTPDGLPAGELQPLSVIRGENAFQLSSELTPRKVTKLPFTQAASSHYHGIEFCLDEQKALERDRGFVRLQSRLIRFETQTTCCKEPCPLPLALSPAPTPSPAAPSEDGESLQTDPPQLRRRSREPDTLTHQHKRSNIDIHLTALSGGEERTGDEIFTALKMSSAAVSISLGVWVMLAKSESSESVGSQCSVGSVTHPAVKALRQQAGRSLSTSSPAAQAHSRTHASHRHSQAEARPQKESHPQAESRSQKHNRMLKEVVLKTLKHYGISSEHECFETCSRRLFDVSKLYLKDLKTSRGLHEEMKKAAGRNAKQVIEWVMEKNS